MKGKNTVKIVEKKCIFLMLEVWVTYPWDRWGLCTRHLLEKGKLKVTEVKILEVLWYQVACRPDVWTIQWVEQKQHSWQNMSFGKEWVWQGFTMALKEGIFCTDIKLLVVWLSHSFREFLTMTNLNFIWNKLLEFYISIVMISYFCNHLSLTIVYKIVNSTKMTYRWLLFGDTIFFQWKLSI